MKAIRIHAYGDAGRMTVDDVPVPACGPGDVLVRLVAAGVNPVDWKLRSGAIAKPLPFALGQDGAGHVVEVGAAVSGLRPGDEVCFYAEFARGGTYAEFVAVDARQVALKPATVPFAVAAALPTPGQAAWTAIVEIAGVAAGMRVLVHGGAGAVGGIAVQLARSLGAHVTATASGAGLERAARLGADVVVDHRAVPFETQVRDVDVVLDTIGGATQAASWRTLRPGGLLVATAVPPPPGAAEAAGRRGAFVFTAPRGAVLAQLCERVDAGLRVAVGEEFALADAAAAHRLGESGRARGKIVLHVAPPPAR